MEIIDDFLKNFPHIQNSVLIFYISLLGGWGDKILPYKVTELLENNRLAQLIACFFLILFSIEVFSDKIKFVYDSLIYSSIILIIYIFISKQPPFYFYLTIILLLINFFMYKQTLMTNEKISVLRLSNINLKKNIEKEMKLNEDENENKLKEEDENKLIENDDERNLIHDEIKLEENEKKEIKLHKKNLESINFYRKIVFIITILTVIIGFSQYFIKQYKEYGSQSNNIFMFFIKFLLEGSNQVYSKSNKIF